MRRSLLSLAVGLVILLVSLHLGDESPGIQAQPPIHAASPPQANVMKINIRIGDRLVRGRLNDSKAARDFASLLPLSVTLTDYASTEKISDLPRRLATDGAPDGFDPSAGDIAYYAPWGNLAIFYKDFKYSAGLVSLGRIDDGLDILTRSGAARVTIERAGEEQ